MKYLDVMETKIYKEADVAYFVDEDGCEIDLTDKDYFNMEVLQVNKSECVGVIEVMFKTT